MTRSFFILATALAVAALAGFAVTADAKPKDKPPPVIHNVTMSCTSDKCVPTCQGQGCGWYNSK
jgi:hypothetical protein